MWIKAEIFILLRYQWMSGMGIIAIELEDLADELQ